MDIDQNPSGTEPVVEDELLLPVLTEPRSVHNNSSTIYSPRTARDRTGILFGSRKAHRVQFDIDAIRQALPNNNLATPSQPLSKLYLPSRGTLVNILPNIH